MLRSTALQQQLLHSVAAGEMGRVAFNIWLKAKKIWCLCSWLQKNL